MRTESVAQAGWLRVFRYSANRRFPQDEQQRVLQFIPYTALQGLVCDSLSWLTAIIPDATAKTSSLRSKISATDERLNSALLSAIGVGTSFGLYEKIRIVRATLKARVVLRN